MKLPKLRSALFRVAKSFLLLLSFSRSPAQEFEDPDKMLRLALDQQRAGNFRLAKELCRRILSENPAYVDARNVYARVISFESNYHEALIQYDSALVFSRDNEDARFGKGQVLGWLGRLTESASLLQGLVDEQPDRPDYVLELAKVLGRARENQKAFSLYQRAFILDPKSEEVLMGGARTAKMLGKKAEAIIWYQRVLAVLPFDPEAQFEITRMSFSASNELQLQTSVESFVSGAENHTLFGGDYYLEVSDGFKPFAHFSSIRKFGLTESNAGAGCYGLLGYGASLFAQVFVSPGAQIIPRVDATTDISLAVLPRVEAIFGYRFLSFVSTKVLLFTPGATIYLSDRIWITPRIYAGQSSDGSSSVTVLATFFLRSSPGSLWRLGFFRGDESFRATSLDQFGSVQSTGVQAGIKLRLLETLGIEAVYQFTSSGSSTESHVATAVLSAYF